MCGIIALVGRPARRSAPSVAEIVQHLDAAIASGRNMVDATSHLVKVNELLKGVPGAVALIDNHELVSAMTSRLDQVGATIAAIHMAMENILRA